MYRSPIVEVAGEVLDELVGVASRTARVGVEVDEHEPAPRGDRGLGQARSASGRAVICGKSHSAGSSARSPSRSHRQPWNGQRNEPTRPSSTRSLVPRCRQALWYALIVAVRSCGDDQRLVGDVVDDMVAGLAISSSVQAQLPRARPQVLGARARRTPATCSGRGARRPRPGTPSRGRAGRPARAASRRRAAPAPSARRCGPCPRRCPSWFSPVSRSDGTERGSPVPVAALR